MVLSSYLVMVVSSTSGNAKNFSIRPRDIKVSTMTSKVVGKLLIKPWKEVNIPKEVKMSSILNSSFKYWYKPIEATLIAMGANHSNV